MKLFFELSIFRRIAFHSVALVLLTCFASVPVRCESWKEVVSEARKSILSLKVNSSRAFDDTWNSSSVATGFIVDAENGLVLTNRHVVSVGPVDASGVFSNNEEIRLIPVYRDPVHDFGFFKYDPADLKFNNPKGLILSPESVERGLEVRVIGNDSGENFSILPGILAKLDRDAPQYGFGRYSDFNTFYFQSASMTSGGSSGSPVIDKSGRVVALNAGGRRGAASAYFLPLGRVQRALELLQERRDVPRGTLNVQFSHKSLGELSKLGIPDSLVSEVLEKYPDSSGLLSVRAVLPHTQSARWLKPGDVLLKINSEYIVDYQQLEEILDSSIGRRIQLEIIQDNRMKEVRVPVENLNALVPADFLEVASAVFHRLSYNLSWSFNTPPQGIYLADPGYLFEGHEIPKGSLIKSINGVKFKTLDQLEALLSQIHQGEVATVDYVNLAHANMPQQGLLKMNSTWFPSQRCKKSDFLEAWSCREIKFSRARKREKIEEVGFPSQVSDSLSKLQRSFVYIRFSIPYSVAGYDTSDSAQFEGAGVIVDAQRGLIVTDRNTVLHSVGDISITIGGSVEIPARLVYLHPNHNIALLSYDPDLLGDTKINAVTLSSKPLNIGEQVRLVDMNDFGILHARDVVVESLTPLKPWMNRSFFFHETNMDLIQLDDSGNVSNGILIDESGVRGLWGSFAYRKGRRMEQLFSGIPSSYVKDAISHFNGSGYRSLEAEVFPISYSQARRMGVPIGELKSLGDVSVHGRRQLLRVVQSTVASPANRILKPGDVILRVQGNVVVSTRDLETLVQDLEEVSLEVWRAGKSVKLKVPTVRLDGIDVSELLVWSGAVIHNAHRALLTRARVIPRGVYISFAFYGSPASRDGLQPGLRILEVNETPINSVEELVNLLEKVDSTAVLRVRLVNLRGAERLITVSQGSELWPNYFLERTSGYDWKRTLIKGKAGS